MGSMDEALRDINDEDIGTGGYSHVVGAASALVDVAELAVGRYYMLSTVDCWVKRGASDVIAAKAVASELLLKAGTYWPVRVTAGDKTGDATSRAFFAAIRDGVADGLIYFFKVDRDRRP